MSQGLPMVLLTSPKGSKFLVNLDHVRSIYDSNGETQIRWAEKDTSSPCQETPEEIFSLIPKQPAPLTPATLRAFLNDKLMREMEATGDVSRGR
jgi:hypothetical protein